MLVKHIMIDKEKLTIIHTGNTVRETIEMIDKHQLLSLPVVDGGTFVGVISKKYIYEEFFNTSVAKEDFLELPISQFMKTKIASVSERDLVEVPAKILAEHNQQFIPVMDEKQCFKGIVTHKAIFNTFTKILGFGHMRLEIVTRDVKGSLAALAQLISQHNANIISIAEIDLEVMNLREIILRVDTDHKKQLVDALNKAGFKVNRIDE